MIEYKEIDINERIHFTRKTKKYGIAYFDFCFKINQKGKIEKVFISPSQQLDKEHGWFMTSGISTGYSIEADDKFLPIFRNIRGFYCTVHESISISVATPENTSMLYCDHVGGNIWFKFE